MRTAQLVPLVPSGRIVELPLDRALARAAELICAGMAEGTTVALHVVPDGAEWPSDRATGEVYSRHHDVHHVAERLGVCAGAREGMVIEAGFAGRARGDAS